MNMQPELKNLLEKQRSFFETGATRSLSFRTQNLAKLLKSVKDFENEIEGALKADFGKGEAETFISETGFLFEEIKFTLKNLEKWCRPERVQTPWVQLPGKSFIHSEPLGIVLIIGPWNYPFQLLFAPLVGAMAAGNCAVLKPSELAPHISSVIKKLIDQTFSPEYIFVQEGGIEASTALLKEKWDHIFFTGGTAVGKIVLQEAAKFLTPVTLELGGKSPCLVEETAPLEVTAKRIVWGKFFNAGQTCVAPDYLLVPKKIKADLLVEMKKASLAFFGEDPSKSPDYARIINHRHFDRLTGYLKLGETVMGGELKREERYISPTVLFGASMESPVMQEEIFGPILPVLEYEKIDEAFKIIQRNPNPLALYLFTKNQDVENRVLNEIPFGGGCINDTLVHLTNPRLPFGGVGGSGMGAYHGKYSFQTFSHRKSVLKRGFFADLKLRYPPYATSLPLLRKILG